MVDINVLLLALAFLATAWCFDRFILKRGAVTLNSCAVHDLSKGYWRFVLAYTVKSPVHWGEIRYSLKDRSNPSTVITGRARTLDHALAGINNEFLFIKEKLTATSGESIYWEVNVTVNTVVGHFNPLYKYFPLSTGKTFQVVLNGE